MVGSPGDLPDWTNAILLQGVDGDGNPVSVLLDATGQLYAVLRGIDGSGDPQSVKVDSDGQLYTVLQGASGNAVAVDDDGYISAVLKGSRLGVLTTISVDGDGRIQAFMLDDESQWGDVIKVGNAEMAARLGSPVVFDWRGQTFYVHDFSDGLGAFYCTLSGAGADYAIDPLYKMRGGYSLKLTGGSDSSQYAKAQGICGRNPSDRFGFLVSVSSYAQTTDIILRARPGDTRYIGVLRYKWGTWSLQYLGDDAAYHTIATVYCQNYPYVFNNFKLVIDVSTHKYVRALVNDTEFDLSAYDLESDGSGFPGTCEFEILTTSRVNENDYNYIDHVILTVNE